MEFDQKRTVSPMGLDCNMGAIRAAYSLKDVLCFVHGATGCCFYPRFFFSWHDNFQARVVSSGLEARHVVFGGEEGLEEGLEKAIEVFNPGLIVLQNTCIPALIGDDSPGISYRVSKKTGVRILSVSNPNYKGNQLDGYRNVVSAYITELMQKPARKREKSVNLLGLMPGEHNWRNNLGEVIRILKAMGLSVNCVLVGDGTTVEEIARAPEAEANILIYPEAGLSAAQLMQDRFSLPWIDTALPPLGIEATREWIMKIADFFGLSREAEDLIEEEMGAMGDALSRLEEGQIFNLQFLFGKTYAIESAPFHLPAMVRFLYEDLSMTPTSITFQEYEPGSMEKLKEILQKYQLEPEIYPMGDHFEFLEAVTKNHRPPHGDPWLVIGSSIDAMQLCFKGHTLPVVRFSYPVIDESILMDNPFMGFRGVSFLTQRIHNTLVEKMCYTRYAVGNIPDPFLMAEEVDRSLRESYAVMPQLVPEG